MRINRYLALCGLGSRRKVEQFVREGEVKVNGVVCIDLSTEIDPDNDIVLLNGERVKTAEEMIYLLMNKPKGYLVTKSDEFGRKTVFDLLKGLKTNLFPVGRLDKDSEGLLLLTNDGDFADKVLHPRNKLPKLYKVTISGFITDRDIGELRKGVEIDGQFTLPARVFVQSRSETASVVKITIDEGRNRQLRKMMEKLGFTVTKLKRLQIGEVSVGNLPVGMCRILKPGEVLSILKGHGKRKPVKKRR